MVMFLSFSPVSPIVKARELLYSISIEKRHRLARRLFSRCFSASSAIIFSEGMISFFYRLEGDFNKMFGMSMDIGIDLGTANVLVYVKG